jgi:hypothetical protein
MDNISSSVNSQNSLEMDLRLFVCFALHPQPLESMCQTLLLRDSVPKTPTQALAQCTKSYIFKNLNNYNRVKTKYIVIIM